jgi:hypothetical protein
MAWLAKTNWRVVYDNFKWLFDYMNGTRHRIRVLGLDVVRNNFESYKTL